MATGQSLRASLASVVPTWLQNTPGFRNLYCYAYALALLGDCLREVAWEGRLAAYPGVGTPTANPYIAASRGLIQGPSESNALFAARCLAFRTTWRGSGSPATLVSNLQGYLVGVGSLGAGNYPTIRVVDRLGHFVTANSDTSLVYGTMSWHWDDTNGWVDDHRWERPTVLSAWSSDLWVIIQDPFTHYTNFADPNWTSAWNSGEQTLDSMCPQVIVDGVYDIIQGLKGAHYWVRTLTWVPNIFTFVPAGNIGNASLNVGGVQTTQRGVFNSFWDTAGGG